MTDRAQKDLSYVASIVIAHERMLWALLGVYLVISTPVVIFLTGKPKIIVASIITGLLVIAWFILKVQRDKYMTALYVMRENLNKAIEVGIIPIAECPVCSAATLVYSDEAVVCSNIRCLYMDFFKGNSAIAVSKRDSWIEKFDNYRSKE